VEVAAFLDWPSDTVEQIAPHLASATVLARSYTRGVGFSEALDGSPVCQGDVAAVIVSATARSVANPEHVVRQEVGTWNAVPARFEGWTLMEQHVLHAYRRRTA
jgi:hypothetical protein